MSCVKSFSAVSLPGAADTPLPPESVAAGQRRRAMWELLGVVWEQSARKNKEKFKKKKTKGGRRGYKTEGKRGESYFGQRRFG